MTEFFRGKTILISGGGGYIAGSLINSLKVIDCRLIILVRAVNEKSPLSFGQDAKATIQVVAGDIRDKETWLKVIGETHFIFHFAAQTSIYEARKSPIDDLKINVLPLLELLEICRKEKHSPSILFAGTVTTFGIPQRTPVSETHPDNPITIYDLHKLTAENHLKHYVEEGVVKGATLRLANVYGPGPKSSRADRGILNQMIGKALRGEALTVYGDGNFMRDYVYIDDVTKSFLAAGVNIDLVNGHRLVIGSGEGTTIQNAFNLVAKRVAVRKNIRVDVLNIDPPSDLPAIERRNFVADISRMSSLTGWTPQVGIHQGIDLTIDWFDEKAIGVK